MTVLYFVHADGFDGEPHGNDLFVRADNPQQAVKIWQDYYETESHPTRVNEIPVDGAIGAIHWTSIPCVWP